MSLTKKQEDLMGTAACALILLGVIRLMGLQDPWEKTFGYWLAAILLVLFSVYLFSGVPPGDDIGGRE